MPSHLRSSVLSELWYRSQGRVESLWQTQEGRGQKSWDSERSWAYSEEMPLSNALWSSWKPLFWQSETSKNTIPSTTNYRSDPALQNIHEESTYTIDPHPPNVFVHNMVAGIENLQVYLQNLSVIHEVEGHRYFTVALSFSFLFFLNSTEDDIKGSAMKQLSILSLLRGISGVKGVLGTSLSPQRSSWSTQSRKFPSAAGKPVALWPWDRMENFHQKQTNYTVHLHNRQPGHILPARFHIVVRDILILSNNPNQLRTVTANHFQSHDRVYPLVRLTTHDASRTILNYYPPPQINLKSSLSLNNHIDWTGSISTPY